MKKPKKQKSAKPMTDQQLKILKIKSGIKAGTTMCAH